MTDRQIYVNLPVKDVSASINFFKQLGYDFEPRFTDNGAGCVVIQKNIFIMLLGQEQFGRFIKDREITNSQKSTEVMIALRYSSKTEVDKLVEKAIQAGGKVFREPQDHGFMYGRSFCDLDSHVWEIFYMDDELLENARNNTEK